MKESSNENAVDSAVKLAKEELQKRYSIPFDTEDFIKCENGPFKEKENIGYVYCSDNPNEKFTVWVDFGWEKCNK